MAYPSQIDSRTLGKKALAFAEEKGWENWSLREFAKHIGVTPNALYRYTSDRQGLAALMGEAATRDLFRFLHKKNSEYAGMHADEVLFDIAKRYLSFARRRPDAYSAFFNGKPVPGDGSIEAWTALWTWIHGKVSAAAPGAEDAAAFAFWAFVHGRAELERGPAKLADKDAGLKDAVKALITGFRQCAPVDSPLPDHAKV